MMRGALTQLPAVTQKPRDSASWEDLFADGKIVRFPSAIADGMSSFPSAIADGMSIVRVQMCWRSQKDQCMPSAGLCASAHVYAHEYVAGHEV